jgi:sigma-B regulation protein RsbQ
VNVIERNNITVSGRPDGRPLVFAHGFGCDDAMWQYVVPAFTDEHRVVIFHHVGGRGTSRS